MRSGKGSSCIAWLENRPEKELLEREGTYREFVRIREQAEGWQI